MPSSGTSTEPRARRVRPSPTPSREDAALHDAVGGALTRQGARYTAHRQTLVTALRGAGQPLTIPQIVAAAAMLPQSSVYRNVALLHEAGIVHRMLGTDDFARYELAEELVGHHHHMVCSKCGAVADVTLPQDAEEELERVLRRVARRHGFALASHRLDLVGDCTDCEGRPD